MTVAHETSTAFSEEVIKEHAVFELSKKEEMKDMLQDYADGQVEMFQKVSACAMQRFSLALLTRRLWTTGIGSYRFYRGFEWTCRRPTDVLMLYIPHV